MFDERGALNSFISPLDLSELDLVSKVGLSDMWGFVFFK